MQFLPMVCRVVVVALPEMNATSMAVTLQALDAANRLAPMVRKGPAPFRAEVGSIDGKPVRCGPGGFVLATERLSQLRPNLVVIPGTGAATERAVEAMLSHETVPALCSWLQRHAKRTLAASCTGVFVLAKAGLLDGVSATTTWWLAPTLQAMFPEVRVQSDAMVLEERGRCTAGASLAQLDLLLHLIRRETSPSLAELVARYLVVEARPSQAPYLIPAQLARSSPEVTAAEQWIRQHVSEPVAIPALARRVGLSPRTFARRVLETTGSSPLAFVRRIRVDAARHLLVTTQLSVAEIAERVGYEDPTSLRRAFALLGERPTEVRKPQKTRQRET